ncbi:MAG: glycosyltransferase family 4 protein [Verrucomicrobiota bacterium]
MQPIRVAFLTHEPFYPPSGGGSAEAIYLVEELVQRGHHVHIFCPKLADPDLVRQKFKVHLHEFTTWEMGRYTKLRNFKYLLYPSFLKRMVEQAAKEIKFDAVLSQHAISAVAAGGLKRSLGVPVFMNFLDYLTAFMETWPTYIAPRPVVAALMNFELKLPIGNQADAVFTVSDTLADLFAATGYPREKILPIYYGYDSAIFKFQEGIARGSAKPPVVTMHGSLDFHHVGGIAFEAVKAIFQTRPETVFRFIGHRTAALEKLFNRARAEIPSAKIECTGFVPYHEVPSHLATASVGIIPYEESIGTHCAFAAKAVEYAALGIPLVSTRLKSVQRYFHDLPLVRFSEFNGADFARKAVSWFDESPELIAALGKSASERVRTDLDWRAISRKAVDFLEKILQAKS